MKSLKLQNAPAILIFVVWCTALFTVCFGAPTDFWSALGERFSELNAKDGLLIALSPLVSLVAAGLFPPELKAVIVFWRIKHTLPGHRAFSKYAYKDHRIDVSSLKKQVDPWPTDPAEQNRTWYRLSKRHRDSPAVIDAHRSFLLSRDLTSVAFCFLVIGSIVLFIASWSTRWPFIFLLAATVQYILLSQVGRNSGIRFVKNVLAEASIKT